jgi:hypothetical protein
LKDEHRVGITLRVQGYRAGQTHRGGGLVHPWGQGLTTEVGRHHGGRSPPRCVVVCGGQIGLSLQSNRVSGVLGSVDNLSWRKAGDRAAGADPQVPGDERGAGVGDRGARQHRETLGRSQPHRGLSRKRRRRSGEAPYHYHGGGGPNRQPCCRQPTAQIACPRCPRRCHDSSCIGALPRSEDHQQGSYLTGAWLYTREQ